MPEWLYWTIASIVGIVWIVSMMIAAQRRDERLARNAYRVTPASRTRHP